MEKKVLRDFVDYAAEGCDGVTKTKLLVALSAAFDGVKKELAKGNKVYIAGLGTFTTQDKPARNGVNPATGEKIIIGARTVVKFKAASTLLEEING